MQSEFNARWGVAHGTLTDLSSLHYASANALQRSVAAAVRAAYIAAASVPKASLCVCCTCTTLHHGAKRVPHVLRAAVDAAAS